MTTQPPNPPASRNDARAKEGAQAPTGHCIDSASLFGGARTLAIRHDGRTYQLRITQSGKLILTA